MKSAVWRKIAPTLFDYTTGLYLDNIQTKASSDGNVSLLTPNITTYRSIKNCWSNNVLFHSFNIPEDYTFKDILRGLPTDISDDEVRLHLKTRGFEIKLIKRFGLPLNLCLLY